MVFSLFLQKSKIVNMDGTLIDKMYKFPNFRQIFVHKCLLATSYLGSFLLLAEKNSIRKTLYKYGVGLLAAYNKKIPSNEFFAGAFSVIAQQFVTLNQCLQNCRDFNDLRVVITPRYLECSVFSTILQFQDRDETLSEISFKVSPVSDSHHVRCLFVHYFFMACTLIFYL